MLCLLPVRALRIGSRWMSTDGSRPSRRTRRSEPPPHLSPSRWSFCPLTSHPPSAAPPIHSIALLNQLSSSYCCGPDTALWWSKEEQSAALSTATGSTAQELAEWNARYREKFGFVFMICASGRTAPEVLAELKRRYTNRSIVELEAAAQEELKITELRLAKLFSSEPTVPSTEGPATQSDKAAGSSNRSRPPITTHVLDTARGSPASGIEVHLEMWKDSSAPPSFSDKDFSGWSTLGYSVTNNDGRSGQLMGIVDNIAPGFYRISFDTGKYSPAGFFPYVSIIFEIKENQTAEHFHVPLLHSPFSFTTYRGS